MKEFYTPEEVAELLRVSGKTIRKWLRLGSIKGVKVLGTRWRIPKDEVERLEQGERPNKGRESE